MSPTREELQGRIAEHGYWRITSRPLHKPRDLVDLPRAKEILSGAAVDLVGWDYPHIPTVDTDRQRRLRSIGDECVEGLTDNGWYKEIVRLYRTGHFYHVMAFWEDWVDEWPEPGTLKGIPPDQCLDWVSAGRTVTELFLFLKNLTLALYPDGASVTLKMEGVLNRQLLTIDPGRMPLRDSYECLKRSLEWGPIAIEPGRLLESPLDLAADWTLRIYRAFNWDSVPIEAIKDNQRALLKRR